MVDNIIRRDINDGFWDGYQLDNENIPSINNEEALKKIINAFNSTCYQEFPDPSKIKTFHMDITHDSRKKIVETIMSGMFPS